MIECKYDANMVVESDCDEVIQCVPFEIPKYLARFIEKNIVRFSLSVFDEDQFAFERAHLSKFPEELVPLPSLLDIQTARMSMKG